jgi:hypothetical protein
MVPFEESTINSPLAPTVLASAAVLNLLNCNVFAIF